MAELCVFSLDPNSITCSTIKGLVFNFPLGREILAEAETEICFHDGKLHWISVQVPERDIKFLDPPHEERTFYAALMEALQPHIATMTECSKHHHS